MEIKLHNSLTNKLEILKPLRKNEISMYVCGPTVYDYVHIGNMRPVVAFDVLNRFLGYVGYRVKFVSNYTDVDDRIIKKALETGKSEKEITDFYIAAFEEDLKNINAMKPDVSPRVTDYMPQIIAFIEKLIKKEAAYVIDGDVYFRVNRIKDYGILSNAKIEDLLIGARIAESEKKESPVDFALWKKADVGLSWDSPWSKGRPGWHTECVVMINELFLHGHIDIHGGGFDLKFPHHENEIAQSEACNCHKIANIWMHNGFINMDNEKMSKSLGNVVTAHEALKKYGGNNIRLLLISTHYRAPVNFSESLLTNNQNELVKIYNTMKQLAVRLQLEKINLENGKATEMEKFLKALADDLNTSNAISELYQVMKKANQFLRSNLAEIHLLSELFFTLRDMLYILGLDIKYPILTEEDRLNIIQYNEAKADKKFLLSDELRDKLIARGIM